MNSLHLFIMSSSSEVEEKIEETEYLGDVDEDKEKGSDSSLEVGHERKPENLLFFWLGNAALLAWNMVLNALDIYFALMPNKDIGVNLSRAYQIPCSIMAFILCFIKPSNYFITLIIAIVGMMVTLAISPILFSVNLSEDQLFWGTMITVGLMSIFGATTYSCTYSFATKYGNSATAASSSGQGCCGVLASIVRIITKAAFNKPEQLQQTSIAYFVIAIIILFLTLIYFIIKSRNPDIKESLHASQEIEKKILFSKVWETFKIVWLQLAAIAFNFFITLLLYPGYVSRVPMSPVIGDWTYVCITFVFGVCDWIGRYLPSHFVWPPVKWAHLPALIRLTFFIIFMIPIEFDLNVGNPIWVIIWQIPFAFSNGYFDTVNFIYGSSHEGLDYEGKRIAGFFVSFAVNFGILIAMFVSYGLPPEKTYS